MPGIDPDGVDDISRRVRDGVSRLRGLDIGDELSVEILGHLVEGDRTVAEIVERSYGLKSSDEGYYPAYRRVSRGVRKLESKGLVSRKIFGRDKPYRLTDLAVINLARIGGNQRQISILTKADLTIFVSTLGISLPLVFLLMRWTEFSEPVIVSLFGCFCFLLGLSLSKFVQVLRRVV